MLQIQQCTTFAVKTAIFKVYNYMPRIKKMDFQAHFVRCFLALFEQNPPAIAFPYCSPLYNIVHIVYNE